MHFEGTVEIAASRDKVWAFVIDPTQVGLEHGELKEGGGGRHGGKVRREGSETLNPAPIGDRRRT